MLALLWWRLRIYSALLLGRPFALKARADPGCPCWHAPDHLQSRCLTCPQLL